MEKKAVLFPHMEISMLEIVESLFLKYLKT